jgi:hypothetical protein
LHSGAGWSSSLGPESNRGIRLISLDRSTCNVHVHGLQIQSVEREKMSRDGRSNPISVRFGFVAAATPNDGPGNCSQRQKQSCEFHSITLSDLTPNYFLKSVQTFTNSAAG